MDNLAITFPPFKPVVSLYRKIAQKIGVAPSEIFFDEVWGSTFFSRILADNFPQVSLKTSLACAKFLCHKEAEIAHRHPYLARLLIIPHVVAKAIDCVGLDIGLIVEQVVIALTHMKRCVTDKGHRFDHFVNISISVCWIGTWILGSPIIFGVCMLENAMDTFYMLKDPYKHARFTKLFFESRMVQIDHLKSTSRHATAEYHLLNSYVHRKLRVLNQKTPAKLHAKGAKGPTDAVGYAFLQLCKTIMYQQRPFFEEKLKQTRNYQVGLQIRDAWELFIEALGNQKRTVLNKADFNPKPLVEKAFKDAGIPLTA
jgi:hypothetical protein